MRIILLTIFVLGTIWESTGQNNVPITVSSQSAEEMKKVEETPVNQLQYNFSTMPGQPMISGSMRNAFNNASTSYNDIDGSPYLNPEPVLGVVTLINGQQYKDVPLEVDLYSRDFIATVEEGKRIALNTDLYQSFVIPHNGKDLLFEKVNQDKPKEFYIVVYKDEDYTLFKNKNISFKEGVNKGLTYTSPKFIERNDYYISYSKKLPTARVKLKTKDIINNIPKQDAKVLSRYIAKNKLKLKSEEDFVKALQVVSDEIAQ